MKTMGKHFYIDHVLCIFFKKTCFLICFVYTVGQVANDVAKFAWHTSA